jgi:hypothetical protein
MTTDRFPTLRSGRRSPRPEHSTAGHVLHATSSRENAMGGLIYLIGLIVVIMFILSLLGLR